MYEDFKKIKETQKDVFENANWQCVVKEADNFTIDLITYTDSNIITLIHVGKNGYTHEDFHAQDFEIGDLIENEINDLADMMVYKK